MPSQEVASRLLASDPASARAIPAGDGARPDVAQLTWADHKLLHPHLAEYLEAVERAAREAGADPSSWRLTYSRVWMDDWLTVEKWRDGRWATLWARHPKPKKEDQAPPCAAEEAGPGVEGAAGIQTSVNDATSGGVAT